MLYCAEISEFEHNLHKEISEIEFFDTPPADQTYPQIQPLLVKEVLKRGFCWTAEAVQQLNGYKLFFMNDSFPAV